MRITSGTLKGRVLKGISTLDLRPTTGKSKEAMFSSLLSVLSFEGKNVLDFYAGSGALGIEAISRGAAYCLFVEKNPKTYKQLLANFELLGVKDRCRAVRANAVKFLQDSTEKTFNLVLADPPYGSVECSSFLSLIAATKLLEDQAIVVFEDSREAEEIPSSFELFNAKKYGETHLSFFRFNQSLR